MTQVLRPSDRAAVADAIDPDAYTAAAYSTAYIHVADFEKLMAIVAWGTLGTAATINAKFEQATTSGGAGVKDITGKAMTEVIETASPTPNDQQAIINVAGEDLDADNGFDYVRLTVTVGVATSDMGAVLLGMNPRYGPASDNDAASVVEIV